MDSFAYCSFPLPVFSSIEEKKKKKKTGNKDIIVHIQGSDEILAKMTSKFL